MKQCNEGEGKEGVVTEEGVASEEGKGNGEECIKPKKVSPSESPENFLNK